MTLQSNIAEVAVTLPIYKKFNYSVPEKIRNSVSIGSRVLVPLGNREVIGYVIKFKHDVFVSESKDIVNVMDEIPLFPETMIDLFNWLSDYYICPLGELIKAALPPGLGCSQISHIYLLPDGELASKSNLSSKLEKKLLESLLKGLNTLKKIENNIGCKFSRGFLNGLELKKWIKIKQNTKFGKIRVKTTKLVSGIYLSKNIKISKKRKKILNHLDLTGELKLANLISYVKTTPSLVRKMVKDGQLKIRTVHDHELVLEKTTKVRIPSKLTKAQKDIIQIACESISREFKTFLMTGLTGSAKIESYTRLAKTAIKLGLSVLVLVPEIALISRIEQSFRYHFANSVAILHSGLSKYKLHTEWLCLLNKKKTIAIGTRSCVFAPLDNLGLIIVDEEHNSSYKQEKAPFYNGKDVAIVRAKNSHATIVLGSTTPSVQSWFNVQNGKFIEIPMAHHIQNQPLPKIDIIDLSKNRTLKGIDRYFTPLLVKQMKKTLAQGHQILLFLNRRGFAPFSICMNCGKSVRCINCDISLTLHKETQLLLCHYCGFSKPLKSVCSFCNSSHIKSLGLGTEKLEIMLKIVFPHAKVARIDGDTVKDKGVIKKVLKALEIREIDVLIGTQLITKMYDFRGIKLVGIMCADLTMNFPDFRSSEKTFQLLSQVSRYASQSNFQGKVILQTYSPDHFTILAAQKQDFEKFYLKEIEFRKMLTYPPFSRMIQLRISGKKKLTVRAYASILHKSCLDILNQNTAYRNEIEILGPIESPLSKIDTFYRWQIILKSFNSQKIHDFIKKLLPLKIFKNKKTVKISIDVDPISIM